MHKEILKKWGLYFIMLSIVCSFTGCSSMASKMNDIEEAKLSAENEKSEALETTEEYKSDKNSTEDNTTQYKSETSEHATTEVEKTAEIEETTEVSEENTLEGVNNDVTDIPDSEWKSAYEGRIREILDEKGYVDGYLYDVDQNGIPELFIGDSNLPQGETYTYTSDGMISLGSIASAFGHMYYKNGYLIKQSSTGGSPGKIWVTAWNFDGTTFQTVVELEFDCRLGDDSKPLVSGAGSYDEAVGIIEDLGMTASFTDMEFDGETYCQMNIDVSGLESIPKYDDDFITAVENY